MTNAQERRAVSDRVAIETLVEVCGNEPGIPPFEAEAVDVSARGMHLRTAYLPEEGAPLVCRFENQGREIVVEGLVAWRKESTRGGEFGVMFTALDKSSVDALRGLVSESLKHDSAEGSAGARVRLHIEGLGSPMKARVRGGGTQKLEVGSNLEFLKVGRKLEIEDIEMGGRRHAMIDGVDVVVDQQTRVPQLVVALRYEGAEDDTPQPSVTHLAGEQEPSAERLRLEPQAVTTSTRTLRPEAPANRETDGDDGDDSEDADELSLPEPRVAASAAAEFDPSEEVDAEDAEALRSKLGAMAGGASKAAASAGAAMKRASFGAWRGMGKLFQGAGGKIAALRSRSAEATKRTTAAPPGGPVSIEGKRLRPQQGSQPTIESKRPLAVWNNLSPKKKVGIAAGASVVLMTLAAVAMKKGAEPPGATASTGSASIAIQVAPESAAAAQGALGANAAMPGALPGAPGALPANLMNPGAGPAASAGAVSANVPLFGPVPMATTEPAPLGPSAAEPDGVEASELAEAKQSAKSLSKDEEFPEESEAAETKIVKDKPSSTKGKSSDKKDEVSSKRPEDVAPFGHGKLHLPTIHRIRLDGPGAEIRGVTDPTGFTVLIPNRKMMEQGSLIGKTEPRIARIRTTNTPGGAQLRVSFKDGVPGYRVRLRRDFVELLISASIEPEKSAKDGVKPLHKATTLHEGSKHEGSKHADAKADSKHEATKHVDSKAKK